MELAAKYIDKYSSIITSTDVYKINGKVTDVIGLVIVSIGPNVSLGEVCTIVNRDGTEVCRTEVVGFKEGKVLSIAIGNVENISPSCEIIATGRSFSIGVGDELLGRVIDGMGEPIDGKGPIQNISNKNILFSHRQQKQMQFFSLKKRLHLKNDIFFRQNYN